MRTPALVLFCLLALVSGLRAEGALFAVRETGPRSRRINVVFLSEGYTAAQMGAFAGHVETARQFLFTREPWLQYRDYCNVYRIEIASNQSGCDNGHGSGAGGSRDTYFNTGFNTPSVTQLLTLGSDGYGKAYALLNAHVPEHDIAIVLVNDAKYGGSGGSLAVASVHGSSAAIVEHEIGHSFALLADEYDILYTAYTPAERPNTTARTTRTLIRWNHWIDAATPIPTPETAANDNLVGLFEGSMYRISGWYRPHNNSLMRNLARPVGPVNREQFVLRIYDRVGPVNASSPASPLLAVVEPARLDFAVTPKTPADAPALVVGWRVNGVLQTARTGTSFALLSDLLGDGAHTVSATIHDPTAFVRLDPAGLLTETVSWQLAVSGQLPATLAGWRDRYGAEDLRLAADGLPNLVKYALGLDPASPAAEAARPSTEVRAVPESGLEHLTLRVPRRLRRPDVDYIVQVSTDLAEWRSGAGHTVTIEDSDTLLVVRDAQPLGSGARRFMRLVIQPTP